MKKKQRKGRVTNRRARYDYELEDSLVVGIALTGAETKALRMGHADLTSAFVNLKDGELWLIGAQIFGSGAAPISESDQTRTRKLLAKASEIKKLADEKTAGRTIVPLEILNEGRFIKLRIAAGKGKKRYDKRETIKRREAQREAARQFRNS